MIIREQLDLEHLFKVENDEENEGKVKKNLQNENRLFTSWKRFL